MKMIFESEEPITLTSEDSGMALLVNEGEPCEVDGDEDTGIGIRIVSWDESKSHSSIRKLEGKRVRITLKVID